MGMGKGRNKGKVVGSGNEGNEVGVGNGGGGE